jgi:hypothetical protein
VYSLAGKPAAISSCLVVLFHVLGSITCDFKNDFAIFYKSSTFAGR